MSNEVDIKRLEVALELTRLAMSAGVYSAKGEEVSDMGLRRDLPHDELVNRLSATYDVFLKQVRDGKPHHYEAPSDR